MSIKDFDDRPHRAGADTEGRVSPTLWGDYHDLHKPTIVDRLSAVNWDRIGRYLAVVIILIGFIFLAMTIAGIVTYQGDAWSLIGQSWYDTFLAPLWGK